MKKMAEIVCDPVLLTKLKKANKGEIDELIHIITDEGRGRLALDREIKKKLIFAKNSKAYADETLKLLAREIQSYGGDSIVNKFRTVFNKNLVSYNEIVSDVYIHVQPSKLTNPINLKELKNSISIIKEINVTEKEIEIVKRLFGDDWQLLSFEERHKKSLNFTSLSAKKLIVRALIPAPLLTARGMTGLSSAPAERITVPCVAILGCMELRLRHERELKNQANSSSVLHLEYQQPVSKILDKSGEEILSLKAYDANAIVTGKTKKMAQEQISRFNSLLSSLPSLASFAELQKGGYVLCDIPFDR